MHSRHTRGCAGTFQAKREAVRKLREQISQETDPAKKAALIQEFAMEQLDMEQLESTIRRSEQKDADFENRLFNKQRELDQIRADFDKNNAEFESNMQAEAARKSELLKERREAAKVCKRLLAGMCGW